MVVGALRAAIVKHPNTTVVERRAVRTIEGSIAITRSRRGPMLIPEQFNMGN